MIYVEFNKGKGLSWKYYVVKVSYTDPATHEECVGLKAALYTKLSEEQVASILLVYLKDSYKLTIECRDKYPKGFGEVNTIDTLVTDINGLRFYKTSCIEVPKIVYIQQTKTIEL